LLQKQNHVKIHENPYVHSPNPTFCGLQKVPKERARRGTITAASSSSSYEPRLLSSTIKAPEDVITIDDREKHHQQWGNTTTIEWDLNHHKKP
jgi:hypothetical protein